MLACHPSLYLRVLRWLGRGSLEKRIYFALIRKGDVIFDVGANHGYFTRLFSCAAGPGGSVHAFEPVPPTFADLCGTMNSTPGFANFTLNNFALGDTEGTAELHLPGDDDGQASMRMHNSGSWIGPATVHSHRCPVTTLDAYAAEMQRLDFVKCDVEGAELLVVRGAEHTLRRLSPVLFLEVNPDWTEAFGYTPHNLVSRLREAGYDTFFLAADDLAALEDTEFSGSANLLCAKSRIHADRLRGLDGV